MEQHQQDKYRYTPEDNRSDSGLSSLRSNSGDERSSSCSRSDSSGSSRSSVLSTSEDSSAQIFSSSDPPVPTVWRPIPSAAAGTAWRDPNLWLTGPDPHRIQQQQHHHPVRHIDSVQHRSLLMSHTGGPQSASPSAAVTTAAAAVSSSSAAASAAPASVITVSSGGRNQHHHQPQSHPPPTTTLTLTAVPTSSGSSAATAHPSQQHFQTAIPMLTPHPIHHQLSHHPPVAAIYSQLPEMLWKQQQRYASMPPMVPSHSLHPAAAEELMDRERAAYVHDRERQDRLIREHQEREVIVEKHKEREREIQLERERAEKERIEKQRAEQQVHKHFEESLRLAQQKRNCWNLITSLPPPPTTVSNSMIRNEEDRKRISEHEQRIIRPEPREREKVSSVITFPPYTIPVQKQSGNTNNIDYLPPGTVLTHNRMSGGSGGGKPQQHQQQISLPKSEPNYNAYGYPAYQAPLNFLSQDKLTKLDHLKKTPGGLVINSIASVNRGGGGNGGGGPPHHLQHHQIVDNNNVLMEINKSSVIVKNDNKTMMQQQHHSVADPLRGHPADPLRGGGHSSSHSVSPKLRANEYLQPNVYHRSPTQSPLHASTTSPRQPPQRQSPLPPSQHHRQSPLQRHSPHPPVVQPPQHRSSPHHHHQSPPEQQQRFITAPPGITLYPKQITVGCTIASSSSYHPYNSNNSSSSVPTLHHPGAGAGVIPVVGSLPKIKVSSPAPPHIYGKPMSGITTGTPVCRAQEISLSPIPLLISKQAVITPSPYQQLTHHQLPPTAGGNRTATTTTNLIPPPAHSTKPTHKPPAATAAAAENTPPPQMQPLDLGVSLKRKWPDEEPPGSAAGPENYTYKKICSNNNEVQQQQLEKVTQPSHAATTNMTAVVNKTIEASLASPPPPLLLPPLVMTPPSAAVTPTPPPPSDSPPVAVLKFEKSCSPKPPAAASYGGHKLKKAWLQRHSGGDGGGEETTGVSIKSGCSISPPALTENDNTEAGDGLKTSGSGYLEDESSNDRLERISSPVASAGDSGNVLLHSIGSMAVNSIKKPKSSAGKKLNRSSPLVLNGHSSSKANSGADDSSSSDLETSSSKRSPKRLPPKVKRKRFSVPRTHESDRKKFLNFSSTDSEKESGSEKDSDTSRGGVVVKDVKSSTAAARKRGRKPKSSSSNGGTTTPVMKNDSSSSNGEGSKDKKSRDDWKDPFPKPPISQLKKTGESFLQDGPCFEVAPKLAKCRECRWTPNQRSRNNIFCRFYAFRRLRYTKNGQLAIAGFSDPFDDASPEDLSLWLPNMESPPSDLDVEMARFLLCRIGDQFCDLLMQESEALEIHIADDKKIAWKRVVQGVREMCDVCETTLFNLHWACSKCGFVVCIDCYKGRKTGSVKMWGSPGKDRDDLCWLLCTNRQAHEQDKLMLTQIIGANCVTKLAKMSHEYRAMWNVPMQCDCPLSKAPAAESAAAAVADGGYGVCLQILEDIRNTKNQNRHEKILTKKFSDDNDNDNGNSDMTEEIKKEKHPEPVEGGIEKENDVDNDPDSKLKWLADIAVSNDQESKRNNKLTDNEPDKKENADEKKDQNDNKPKVIDEMESKFSEDLDRSMFRNTGSESPPKLSPQSSSDKDSDLSDDYIRMPTCDNIDGKQNLNMNYFESTIKSIVKKHKKTNVEDCSISTTINGTSKCRHYIPKYCKSIKWRDPFPVRSMSYRESSLLYPDVPHGWLCEGKLLRLLESDHMGNYIIFQDQWKRGQPVIVNDVTKKLDKDLWRPESFARDFGEIKNDLVNCMNGHLVQNQPMRKFWEGFECPSRRLKDDKGNTMLLKLKDWPPGEDFAEMLPTRYNDLMNALPLAEYTQRNGKLNLASRLPECFVRPDLGPKMYNAYGGALHPGKGTTNLHLDISDAVNVMVYVGVPKDDEENEEFIKEAYRAIDEGGCDLSTRRRIREKGAIPGALWHIYHARDADKIRDLLNKVAIENGKTLKAHHDPIHDQSWYLNDTLRERLFKEYGVEGYAIVQCLGDAVFIPAGAPHQVRNLHNCIKVAEDFVSPENVSHCFHLTQEFRNLSNTHSNHEDKLQIKNIMYHAVKDSLSVLGAIYAKTVTTTTNTASSSLTTTTTTTTNSIITNANTIKQETVKLEPEENV